MGIKLTICECSYKCVTKNKKTKKNFENTITIK